MLTMLKDIPIKKKFQLIALAFGVTAIFSIWGMLEIAKTTQLQRLERNHIEFNTLLWYQAERYVNWLQEGTPEALNKAKQLLNVRSETQNKEMGILQLFEGLKKQQDSVFTETNALDRVLLNWFGFGRAFELAGKLGPGHVQNMQTALNQLERKEWTVDQFGKSFLAEVNGLQERSAEFAGIVNNASRFIRNLIITLTLVFLGLVVALLFLILTPLNTAITYFTDIAHVIANGDLRKRIEIDQQDEIGHLADAFRDMQQRIAAVAQETKTLTQQVQAGELASRGNVAAFTGDWAELINALNGLIEAFVAPINVTARYIRRIAKGDLPDKITDAYQGDFNKIKKNLNRLIDALSEITRQAALMAAGDLTAPFQERSAQDLLMRALNGMRQQLHEVVMGVQAAADNLATGSQAMSSSAEQMSQGSSEQAAAAEEASASMEQMAANIGQNAENASQTEKIALQSANDARESGQAVAETVIAMNQIAEKIAVIEEIARQTRMLSLNATIEAAKAEQYGKGFAVVAAEIRSLAEHTREAAEQIGKLVNAGVAIANNAGERLARLVPDIQKTTELVQEISAASNEQNSGVTQINRAIQQLDQVIQQNASIAEEVAATAEELTGQAEQLRNTMGFFTVAQATAELANVPERDVQLVQKPAVPARKSAPPSSKARKPTKQDSPLVENKTAAEASVAASQEQERKTLEDEFERY